ncbi:MAG: polyphosphate polymerase domain-containing protein [Verrucomicrobiales bacterium]|nr:polyphosphate polymerase domain-containing protein [Verrucomicrobiales bacterium]
MSVDRMQAQRFEQKYLIDEDTALKVRDFVQAYLELDEYGEGKPNLSYPVHSLYLDNDDLRLARETINGNKNRFKLRIRFYNNNPDTPVFFEIKRRMNNCIMKQRGGVRHDAVEWLLAGHIPEYAHLVSKEPKQLISLQRFCELTQQICAKPKVHIAYLREAYVHPTNNSVRVTLDRVVRASYEPTARLSTEMKNPVIPFGRDVILELKFTNHFPSWFGELVRVFGCMQCGAAKYVEGAENLGFVRARQRSEALDDLTPDLGSANLSTIVLPKPPDLGTLSSTAR